MRKAILYIFLFAVVIFLSFSCKSNSPSGGSELPAFTTFKSDSAGRLNSGEKNEILYGLLTPTEISAIFSRLGISYDKTALNSINNNHLYQSNSKAAINLGIYGVDFGYVKMFSIGQQMIDYIFTIKGMSNKLGIPDELLMNPIRKIQNDMSSPDSVMALLNQSYTDIENHLRKTGRESTAGLMLMGGWVEALYITSHILYNPDNPDREVSEKIAQQKYTLTSLLSFMKNYYDDPVVVYYTKKLIYLKRYYDTFDIYFKKGDLEIDINRQVLKASPGTIEMTASIETINKIRAYVNILRTEMITP